ncbi:lipopolysaccharide transport periplasmic protein LptA [Azohydromonas aeria]|uniref:lipopolysaccharide transport periplasmic protein LptA n=1 Tax=Azohydromonas aeria TaxID=2590212 RepID=UPI0012FC3F6C|nr:lipopolysaccharide transport periplasmic protein LptA [Azohydromonas aeria]
MSAALALSGGAVLADRADRNQPLVIEADKPGTVDMQKKVVVFNGNVVVTQGTMRIRSEHMEVHDVGEGHRTAVATGTAGQQATFRQKREGLDEYIEGRADRIEYDSRSDYLKLIGNARALRLRGSAVADEVTGNLITYDNRNELFSVAGDPARGGRVRAVLTPPPSPDAASSPASGAPRR